MKFPHDLPIWRCGSSRDDIDNQMRLVGFTRLGEMNLVPRPGCALLATVTCFDVVRRSDEQG